MSGAEKHKAVADADDVCVLYAPRDSSGTALADVRVSRVRDGKIAELLVLSPYTLRELGPLGDCGCTADKSRQRPGGVSLRD